MVYIRVAVMSVVSVLVMFLLARLLGRRQITQLDVFDYITGITIGSIAAELAIDTEGELQEIEAMVIYALVAVLLNVISDKSRKAAKFINGDPLTVYDKGSFNRGNMKKAKLDLGEFLSLCRVQGYFDLAQVQTAILETNGKLAILPVTADRPVTPRDMQLTPAQETVFTEFVMDGYVMERNLKNAGFDKNWLRKQLKAQGYNDPAELFLVRWDGQGNLSCYGTQ